jgi:hypothetical protein
MQVLRKLGLTQYQLGDMNAALESYDRYLSLAEKEGTPHDVAFGFERVGYMQARTGLASSGLEKMRQALAMYERLIESDAGSAELRRDLLSTSLLMGDILNESGSHSEAAENFRRALTVADRLAKEDPNNQQSRHDLVLTLCRLSDALGNTDKRDEARVLTNRALLILKPVVERPEASEYDIQQYCWTLLTTPFKDLQDTKTARHYAELLVARTGAADPRMLDLLARAHFASGDVDKAVDAESRAIALLPRDTTSDMAKEFQTNLVNFRSHAPH